MRARELDLSGVRSTFTAMAVVLAVSLAATYLVGNSVLSNGEKRAAHEELYRQVQQAFSTLQDAETGQRGFLLTGKDEYLEPYRAAVDAIEARLRRLRGAAQAGDLPAPSIAAFARLTDAKIKELARTIEVARAEGFPAALQIVQGDVGRHTMEEIRSTLEGIEAAEKQELDRITRDTRELTNLRTAVFFTTALLNLAFLGWAYRRIRREMARRYVADLESQRQRDILAVSLASIGDAVIITDTAAAVTFMNPVAVELTGWAEADAIGQPCAKVFRIVNETTRKPVESPVDMVLRSGKIVGLANHTLLLRKDGTEVPIDDSGAPVREPDGSLRGVILVFRDFSRYKSAEREQTELRQRLEIASKAKDDFLAALSHELRTPLTPVLATLSTWESGRDLPPELAADVKMLTRNVRLEVRLIDDLLDLTRIARGQMTLHRETVDAHALLAAVVEIFRGDLERRQVRLGVRAAAERHYVDADPARLQQVFWNLLGNAAKYTPDGGRIEIVTANDGDLLRVTFADNGRGMSPETIKGLFRPFERTTGQRAYQPGGLGIGLTISQNLMHAQGGEIEARSGGPGLGATFVVRLPALAANEAPPPAGTGHPGGEPEPPMAPLAILLLEDHRDSADVIARILRAMGHSVEVSHTMTEGLAAIREHTFDLVLSDIGLPDGTGIEFITIAREFTATPMIALTGYGMEDDVSKYRSAGFLRQLTKPIRFDQLEDLLRDFARGGERLGGLTVRSQPPGEGKGQ